MPSPKKNVSETMLNAAKIGDFDVVRTILSSHPHLINAQPNGRWSALHQAAFQGNQHAVSMLIHHGADIHLKNRSGKKPCDVLPSHLKPYFPTLFSSPRSIAVVSYNLSWAAARHQSAGSEARFVRDMCLPHQDGHCRKNAIQSLLRLSRKADLYGFQEYVPWGSRFVDRLSPTPGPFINRLPPSHALCSGNVLLPSLFSQGAKVEAFFSGLQAQSYYSALMTCWDAKAFGHAVSADCINLTSSDVRPCFIAYTERRVLIVNAHAPHSHTLPLRKVFSIIDKQSRKVVGKHAPPLKMIVVGDFNDEGYAIPGQVLLQRKLNHPPLLRTCCYDPDFGMQSGKYRFPGDYVLSDMTVQSMHRIHHDGTLSASHATRPSVGRSDHEPVFAVLSPGDS